MTPKTTTILIMTALLLIIPVMAASSEDDEQVAAFISEPQDSEGIQDTTDNAGFIIIIIAAVGLWYIRKRKVYKQAVIPK